MPCASSSRCSACSAPPPPRRPSRRQSRWPRAFASSSSGGRPRRAAHARARLVRDAAGSIPARDVSSRCPPAAPRPQPASLAGDRGRGTAGSSRRLAVPCTDTCGSPRPDACCGSAMTSPLARATEPVVIIPDLPAGAHHWTRSIAFGPDGRLYVAIGSSCDICREADRRRAAIVSYAVDGSNERLVARGLRNPSGSRSTRRPARCGPR